MRRPSIACRRAVQSLQSPTPQHIWISDELLSSTLHQFLRLSCPHQKRHGSHVPGPLEARRRATKRRMTVSANFYPQDSFPSSFNLGALFGFRKNPSQPSWRYEPPSLQTAKETLGPALDATPPIPSLDLPKQANAPPSSKSSLRDAHYFFPQSIVQLGLAQEISASAGVQEDEARSPGIAEKATQSSIGETDPQACFEAFVGQIAASSELANSTRSQNLVLSFQENCPAPESWKYTVLVVRYLLELGWDPTPVLKHDCLSGFAVPSIYSSVTRDVLICLEDALVRYPHCIEHIHQVHLRIAESAAAAKSSYTSRQDATFLLVAQRLWHTAHSLNSDLDNSIIHLLCSVASKVRSRFRRRQLELILSDIAHLELNITHLIIRNAWDDPERLPAAVQVMSCIPAKPLLQCIPTITLDFARATIKKSSDKNRHRMRIWLQLLHQVDLAMPMSSLVDKAIASLAKYSFTHQGEVQDRARVLLNALLLKASQTGAFETASMEEVSGFLDSFEMKLQQSGSIPVVAMFGMLMSDLQRQKLPHEKLAKMIISLLVRQGSLEGVLAFAQVLDRRKLTLTNATPVHKLIAQQMAAIRRSGALTEKSRQSNAYRLQICQKIVEKLSRISSIPEDLRLQLQGLQAQQQFNHILNRAQADRALPLQYRNISASLSAKDRVDLIHQIADQYSMDNTRSQRDAWRAIFYLYKHSEEHSLPIGPLFCKSVVRIAIIRPLSENRFVSTRRLAWVCQLVARVEGDEAAKKLESTFWHWRGDLMRHAKDVYVGMGGHPQDRARISTMKKLGLI